MLLSGQPLSLREIAAIADASVRVQIAPAAIAQMEASRDVVRRVGGRSPAVYGINTGFGKLCEVRIPDDELARLQLNLVRSHACGLGAPLSEPETRVIVALRANTLALGYSGVRPIVAQTLGANAESRRSSRDPLEGLGGRFRRSRPARPSGALRDR